MKNIIGVAIIALIGFSACSQYNMEPSDITPNKDKIPSTTTIAEVKEKFIDKKWKFFGSDLIEADEAQVINGIITTTDIAGNIYKYIVVQEEEPNGQAIRVSIDAPGLASLYPLGQRVSIVLNDLYIGQYGQSPQIGIFGMHKTRGDEPEQTAAIPMPLVRNSVFRYGSPEPEAVVADTMTIAEIKAMDPNEIAYRLVCIKDAYFTGKGSDFNLPGDLPDKDKIFAPGTDGKNFPQAREITDGTGSVFIATSEFARFATYPLPAPSFRGNITALIGWYNNRDIPADPKKIYHQLTLRTLDDLGTGFEGYKSGLRK